MKISKTQFIDNKYVRIFIYVILIPIAISLILIVLNFRSPDKINSDNGNYDFILTSDSDAGGKSKILEKEISDSIKYKYKLIDGVDYPFASLEIRSKKDFIDISKYDYLNLNVQSDKSKTLVLSFYAFLDGYSSYENFYTYLPLTYVIPMDRNKHSYEIDIDQFSIPEWWYLDNKLNKIEVSNSIFSKVIYISLSSNPLFPLNEVDSVTFNYLHFFTSISTLFKFIFKILFIYYLFLLFYFLLSVIKKRREQYKLIRYNAVNTLKNSPKVDDLEKYIGLNFSDPLLNLPAIAEELKISERSVSNEIKSKYNLTFPAYLNMIRINEAKDLLKENDNKIIDIALAVGYNNASHFNRIFRKIENITPTEFRKINLP